MARQLVYTSAPQGLTPGRTGYGTVARHADLRERLVPVLERLSVFPSDWQPTPVIFAFRLVEVGGTRVPVLSRLIDAGHDYTHRSHFLAHHLIFDPAELAGAPTPADIFLRWPGWLTTWDGPPRWLDEKDLVDLTNLPAATTSALPAQTWQRLAGDAARAALLADGLQAASRVLRCSEENESDLIQLLRESSALLPSGECWRAEFTTCLLPSESASSYRWAGVRAGSPADTAAIRTGTLLDLTLPGTLPPPPITPSARLAREGPLQAKTPAVAPPRPTAPVIQKIPLIQKVPLTMPGAPKSSPAPTMAYAPATGIPKPARKSALKQSTAIFVGVATAVIVIGVVGFMLLKPANPEPATTSTSEVPPAPPMPIFNPTPASPPVSASPPAPGSPSSTASPRKISPPTANESSTKAATTNEQVLMDIQRLAGDGKFLDALTRWKTLATDAPDFVQAHQDVLQSQLLPGARKEWLDTLNHLKAQLADGPAKRADLAAQFAALRDFPKEWPVANPAELTQAADDQALIFTLLSQLPDAPVFIVDGFTTTGAGADYKDATVTLSLPELSKVLAAGAGQFQISAAAATSIIPPPEAQWFKFDVQAPDFSSGDFLILPDASRGDAGGRFLQLLVEGTGQTRLTWRLFQPQSDFFKHYPANAPLGPTSREMWLHFASQPPLQSFYLLLRRPDSLQLLPWKPLALPLAWIESSGAPSRVSLPTWLTRNLPWHALPGQSFHLTPTLLDPLLDGLTQENNKGDSTPTPVHYDAAQLAKQLNDKIHTQQTDLANSQQQLADLQTALTGPVDRQPTQAMVDQVAENIKKLQGAIAAELSAVQNVSTEDWPRQAAPWMLYDTFTSKDTLIFLQFTSHETGSTP